MDSIQKVKSIGLWIFIIPFVAVNTCLILITQFHGLFPNPAHVIHNTFPYFDGGASISRTARVFPTYLVFKPAIKSSKSAISKGNSPLIILILSTLVSIT